MAANDIYGGASQVSVGAVVFLVDTDGARMGRCPEASNGAVRRGGVRVR